MRDTKAYIALKSLNITELNRFKKFVISPYFNKNENVIRLFNLLEEDIRQTVKKSESKDRIWHALFPKEEFSGVRLRKVYSDLLRVVEQFLAQEQFESNPLHKANYLLKAISLKQLDKLYNSTISTVRRLSSRQIEKTASYYYYQYQIEKNLFDLTTEFEKKTKSKSKDNILNISDIAQNLDYFYLAEKMRYYCTLMTWKNIANIDQEVLFIEDTVNQIKSIDYSNIPPITIYYQIYLTTIEPEKEEHFEILMKLIDSHLELFPLEEAKDIYESALNYCVRKVNKGNQSYFQNIFDLYNFGLNSGIILEKNEISPTSVRNICITALRLKKYEWTEQFIEKYKPKINEKYRENAYNFNKARYFWHTKQFDRVISQISSVEFNDIFYELSSKAMLLTSYYELDEIDAMDSLINSFRTFLNRHKKEIPLQRRNNYFNLIQYSKKLSKYLPGDLEFLVKLKAEITQEAQIADKPWLLEKIKELDARTETY